MFIAAAMLPQIIFQFIFLEYPGPYGHVESNSAGESV